jgi:ketosteroid isomerase-like protein
VGPKRRGVVRVHRASEPDTRPSGNVALVDAGEEVGAALRFVAAINGNDVDVLAGLMTPDHRMELFDEEPVVGRDACAGAWQGYCGAFPAYVIHPHAVMARAGQVAVLGHTTGSHLGLPDEVEAEETLIWIVDVDGGLVARWKLLEDTVERRAELGLPEAG